MGSWKPRSESAAKPSKREPFHSELPMLEVRPACGPGSDPHPASHPVANATGSTRVKEPQTQKEPHERRELARLAEHTALRRWTIRAQRRDLPRGRQPSLPEITEMFKQASSTRFAEERNSSSIEKLTKQ